MHPDVSLANGNPGAPVVWILIYTQPAHASDPLFAHKVYTEGHELSLAVGFCQRATNPVLLKPPVFEGSFAWGVTVWERLARGRGQTV